MFGLDGLDLWGGGGGRGGVGREDIDDEARQMCFSNGVFSLLDAIP